MFIKELKIDSVEGNIRTIEFHMGLNLIVDKTSNLKQDTGNNVGKTTVLKLIDYCLGSTGDNIFPSNDGEENDRSKLETIIQNSQVVITLVLVDNLSNPSNTIELKRNFLKGEGQLFLLNNNQFPNIDKFKDALKKELLPDLTGSTNSFRELISHNIRYDDYRLKSTLRTLKSAPNDKLNELYMSLFGCDSVVAKEKQILRNRLKTEKALAKRLSEDVIKENVRQLLEDTQKRINSLELERQKIAASTDFNLIKSQKQKISESARILLSKINEVSMKIKFINDSFAEISDKKFDCDFQLIQSLYKQVKAYMPKIHKSFEELTAFHNSMIEQRRRFVADELGVYEKMRAEYKAHLDELTRKSRDLEASQNLQVMQNKISILTTEISELYRRRGTLEAKISESKKFDESAASLRNQLKNYATLQSMTNAVDKLKSEIQQFNKYFINLSREVYNELNELIIDDDKSFYLGFKTTSESAGKLQGEMFCFDLAYIMYADSKNMQCLHFLLNDKKELMHGNQLTAMSQIMDNANAQLIISILSDKLPEEVRNELPRYEVLSLSLHDKLFKV